MNLPPNIARCVCLDHDNPHRLCLGNNGFKEKRQQVKLNVQRSETVKDLGKHWKTSQRLAEEVRMVRN